MKTMQDYYAGFYEWLDSYQHPHSGVLTDEEQEKIKSEIKEYVELAHPLTKEIYEDMTDEQRKAYPRLQITGTVCGLHVSTRGGLSDEWSRIMNRWDSVIQSRCRQLRIEAGWTDGSGRGTYLVDPKGRTKNHTGMPYSVYAQPSAAFSKGIWDGYLTEDVEFTP